MTPTDIEGKTRTLAEDQPEYMPLPIRDEVIKDGYPVMFSAWAPDAQELERLNNGGRVLLGVVGRLNHPPVVLTTVGPLSDKEGV